MVCSPLCNAVQWEWLEWLGASSCGRRGVVALSRRTDAVALAQAGTFQLDAVGPMNDAIQNRIPDRWVSDQFVPSVHWDLAGHQ
jgi:hypothetical protein